MTIILFDIDGTLIRTGGAGTRAMNRAFEDVFGVRDAFDGVPMAGRTDNGILHDGASRSGIVLNDGAVMRFRSCYVHHLRESLREAGAAPRVLSGVRPLLDALDARRDVFSALLTGNCEEGAQVKLEHFDLWRRFRCGAYGDAVSDRRDLFQVAIERALACGAPAVAAADVVVVGDTVLDVGCARAFGARAVAVATGPTDAVTLRAAGADLVLDDLGDHATFLGMLGRRSPVQI